MWRAITLFSCASLLVGAQHADAQILKCKDSQNRVVYTQGACPTDTQLAEPPEIVDGATATRAGNCSGRDRMSAAALGLHNQWKDCYTGQAQGPGCKLYEDVARRCTKAENRESADCATFRELKAANRCEGDKLLATRPPPTPAPLKCGDSADLAFQGSDEQVRACSRQLSLPSTRNWAQMSDKIEVQPHLGDLKQWSGEYWCLQFIGTPGAIPGETLRIRPAVRVSQALNGRQIVPGFVAEGLPTVFPTKVAAVEAGCQAAIEQAKSSGR